MCQRAKISHACRPGSPPKKKDGRSMGKVPKCAHQIKMKKMGVPNWEKRWGNAHLFEVNFWLPSFAYPYWTQVYESGIHSSERCSFLRNWFLFFQWHLFWIFREVPTTKGFDDLATKLKYKRDITIFVKWKKYCQRYQLNSAGGLMATPIPKVTETNVLLVSLVKKTLELGDNTAMFFQYSLNSDNLSRYLSWQTLSRLSPQS